MPHASLGAAIQAAAATAPSIQDQIKAGIGALEAWIIAKGRSFIDEPGERADIEAEAVKAFNGLFSAELGPTLTLIVDGFVTSAIDRLLVYLAATPVIPAPSPDPAPPATPTPPGAASP